MGITILDIVTESMDDAIMHHLNPALGYAVNIASPPSKVEHNKESCENTWYELMRVIVALKIQLQRLEVLP